MTLGAVILGAVALAPLAAADQTPPPALQPPAPGTSLMQKLVNQPQTATWAVFGARQTSRLRPAGAPQNYPATRVTVAVKGANAWDAGATSPIAKPVAAGDTLLVAVHLRAPLPKDGESAPITYPGLNETAAPPYAMIAHTAAPATNQWKLFYASGRAAKAYAADGVAVGIHLAAARQVVDLGPVRVFDLGPGVDPSRLPKND